MRCRFGPLLALAALLAAGCASPRSTGEVDEARSPSEDGVRILTAPSLLPRSRDVSVAVPDDGYLAIFELRPGRALAMTHPPRNELRRGDGGRIIGLEPDGGRVEEGTATLLRPDWTPRFRDLGRSDWNRQTLGPDITSYSYHCAAQAPRGFGRWLLAVWSPEPLHPENLWPTRDQACGEPMAGVMADSVVARLRGSEDQVVRVDLLEY